ncbi:hypothetical protein SAMN04488564_104137 [Lentzea waywayandensis]|uniref:Uncharacterized protein n=1 Tax=Lentzea waywayandensis TaxID=84724 RepID=A0A1I6ECS2_9PSEU|nr:hypothetical protein [Lentzea waywayandensis]SFR15371.1 hypothetical protein SAMN04488564_104137 [Lentzea waywayandensis]
MDFLLILLQPHVVVLIAIVIVMHTVVVPRWRTRGRAKARAEQDPVLTELAKSLGGSVSGPGQASAWTPRLQRSRSEAELTLDFQRGPWHVRLTEACNPRPRSEAVLEYEHWIEVATTPVPARKIPLEFFTLSFEDGFVQVECQGRIQSDDIVFLVDMILERLDAIRDVEPRDPSAVV